MRFLTLGLSALCALCVAGRLSADIPAPPIKKESTVVVEIDENAKEAKLLIPQSVLRQRIGGVPKGGGEEQEEGLALGERSRPNTLIAGVALALSLSCGGLWLVRRGRPGSGRGVALILTAVVSLGCGAYLWANRAPPPVPKPVPAKLPVAFEGKVEVILNAPREAKIRLVLPKGGLKPAEKPTE